MYAYLNIQFITYHVMENNNLEGRTELQKRMSDYNSFFRRCDRFMDRNENLIDNIKIGIIALGLVVSLVGFIHDRHVKYYADTDNYRYSSDPRSYLEKKPWSERPPQYYEIAPAHPISIR